MVALVLEQIGLEHGRVNSSTNSGTPSVLATIWSSTAAGSALPPLSRATMAAPCRRLNRLRVSAVTWA